MARARIVLGDDHPVLLAGLRRLLEDAFEVVGTATNGMALISAAKKWRPDIVVVDISMPGMNGIDALRRVRRASPATQCVVLSVHSEPVYVDEALRAGARGYVLKQWAAGELVAALQRVLEGKTYVPAALRRSELSRPLTLRQMDVLRLVAEGKTNKEIAKALQISVKTVEFHKANIMSGLDIHTPSGLTRYAIQRGIALN